MQEIKDFDLNNFRSEVFEQYQTLSKMKAAVNTGTLQSILQSDEDSQNSLSYKILKPIFGIAGYFEKAALKKFYEKPDITEYARKTDEILSDNAVKQILCPKLKELVKSNLLVEETVINVIKILTAELLQKEIMEKLSINSDANLFAFIALKVTETGIEQYCKDS